MRIVPEGFRTKLHATQAKVGQLTADAGSENYRGEWASFIVGLALTVGGVIGILWLYKVGPFETPVLVWGQGKTFGISAVADVKVDCPFKVGVRATWHVTADRGVYLSMLFLDPNKEGVDRSVWFFRQVVNCRHLQINVTSVSPNLIEATERLAVLSKDGKQHADTSHDWAPMDWSAYAVPKVGPGFFHLALDAPALQKLGARPGEFSVHLKEVSRAATFSDRDLVVALWSTATDKAGLSQEMLTEMGFDQEVKAIIPTPASQSPYLSRVVFAAPNDGYNASHQTALARVLYTDSARKQEEAMLSVLLPIFLGVGAAGLFQALTGFVGKSKPRASARA